MGRHYFVRPHTWSDLALAWHGSWDSTGIEAPFYRPLTTLFSAAKFELFGFNVLPYRALTLFPFVTAATMAGTLVWTVTRRVVPTFIVVLWLVAYPPLAASTVAWVTNQFHALELVVVIAALLWWWHVRERSFEVTADGRTIHTVTLMDERWHWNA